MTITLPTPLPAVDSWGLSDWLDQSYSSPPASGGVATITLPQLADNVRWNVTHMVIGCTGSAGPTSLRLYLDTVSNGNLRDGTDKGNFSVADWPRGLMIPPSRSLVAVWTGASDGAVGILNVQAEIWRRSS